MSDNKFTPCPWSVATHSYGIVIKIESDRKSKYGAGMYACIGGFNRNDDAQLAEAEANASLIAAAPELLEALQPFAAFACSHVGECMCHNCRARDVIAKAKGEL